MNLLEKYYGQTVDLVDSGFGSGEFNMDFDLDRARAVERGELPAMFRLYAWEPWCLSLGYNQKDDDVDYSELKNRGYELVRRPTGGRAVFHANEITYSFVIKLNDDLNIHEIYKDIHLMFINVFSEMGINLDFIKSGTNLREFYKMEGISNSCFASSARYEVCSGGKKIVGSAQRVIGRTLLQHGSILIGREHLEIVDLLKHSSMESKDRLLEFIKSKSVSLGELSDNKLDYSLISAEIFRYLNSLA